MKRFRITPTFVASQYIYEIERQVGILCFKTWIFESFADSQAHAEKIIAHLGGPIVEVITEGHEVL